MVTRVKDYHHNQEGILIPEQWLKHLATKRPNNEIKLIEHALHLSKIYGESVKTPMLDTALQQGLNIAELLDTMNLDADAIVCALIYPCVRYGELTLEDLKEQTTAQIVRLVQGVMQMDAVRVLYSQTSLIDQPQQMDHLRRMLLAMVQDINVVFIKLAERTCWMHQLKALSPEDQLKIARETHDIYAPLANRLGIGQIKWELEDLSFRYLNPSFYKEIARGLDQKRVEREAHIEKILAILKENLESAHIENFQLQGRAKHIYSIYKKMQRKKTDLSQIYDVSAVRVLVSTIEQCYTVLSLVHALWEPIHEEFDDYIAQPKPNGYRSVHTAVRDEQGLCFEIQIRTFEMHQESELGVAAHWIYKEKGLSTSTTQSSYEQKIAWLREFMSWQREVGSEANQKEIETQIFNDRVYVFTPQNEIIDLAAGATPLDFAYQVHTNIGHRCRGAKVNGQIVPLTYELKTGDRIEILTAKEPAPSRDWMNPSLGYLKSSRARAKILNWFKKKDYDQHVLEGKSILDKEIKRLHLNMDHLKELPEKFDRKTIEDIYAAIATNDIKIGQVIHTLESLNSDLHAAKTEIMLIPTKSSKISKTKLSEDIAIQGVGNLLTYIARCCRPVPGDPIIGYISQSKGVGIHRQDCSNILNAQHQYKHKMIEVQWGQTKGVYTVDIIIKAYDRQGLIRDISTIFANEKINVTSFSSRTSKEESIVTFIITLEIQSLELLSRIFTRIRQLSNIITVGRHK